MSVKDPNPLSRPDVYSLSAGSTSVDASTYFIGDGVFDNTEVPIQNSAGDAIKGLKRRQGEITMTIKGNRAGSPFSLANSLVNKANVSTWANGSPRTWLCTSVSAQQASELAGPKVLDYWQVSFSFAYREDTWDLKASNVGFHSLETVNGQVRKTRVSVQDADGNNVPSANPLPLNLDGTLRGASSEIETLSFRVYKLVDFSQYFSDPPI